MYILVYVDVKEKGLHISTCDRWTGVAQESVVCTENSRPDLVIQKGNDVIDVTVTFDNGIDAFTEARVNKIDKYSKLARELSGDG